MAYIKGELTYIADDLEPNALAEYAQDGVDDVEAYLANWQTFAVKSISKAKQNRDARELATWGISEEDVIGWDTQQLAA